MQTQKPTLELLTCEGAYRDNPTALFHQLCGDRPATLLLESADIDSKDDLKSLLLVDSALRITALGDTVTIQALSGNGEALLALLDNALPAGCTLFASGWGRCGGTLLGMIVTRVRPIKFASVSTGFR